MKKHEELAWALLTDVEKNSLYLTLTNGMSSWEAGEILGLSHYKYLELKERSEKFFRMYVEFFADGIESLFSPDTVADKRFIDYIEACIEKRIVRKDAVMYTGDTSLVLPEVSRTLIQKNIERLMSSEIEHDVRLYKLIMEFDRWNNWRILPRKLQQPSAYKRRNNKRDKVYLRYINKIPEYKISAIKDIFEYSPRKSTKVRFFITLISSTLFTDGYEVISIKTNDTTLKRLSKLCIYAYTDRDQADVFGYMATRWLEKTTKASQGQKFWPEYRDNLLRAVNYNQVNNINFYIGKLDMAYNDIGKTSKKPKKPQSFGVKPSSENKFY